MKFQLAAVFVMSLVVALVGCKSQQAEKQAAEEQKMQAQMEQEQQTEAQDEDDAFIQSLSFNDPKASEPEAETAAEPEPEPEPEVDEEPIGDMITSKDLREGGVNEELLGVALSKEEYKNVRFRTVDLNTRQLVDDWERFWLMDRPSRGSLYPIP